MDYVNGQFTARTPGEFQQLLQMAASGGPTSGGNVGLGMDSPLLAAASTFLPGAQPSVDVSSGYMTSPDVSLKSGLGKYTPRPQMPATGNLGGRINDAGRAAINYVDDLVTPAARTATAGLVKGARGAGLSGIARMAASPMALNLMKVGTGLGALGGVAGAADVLLGKDSAGNKLMDTAAMGIGGALGAVGGPLGIAAGAGVGKMVSDGAQFIFGGGKSAEERKMEEALALLRGGQI